MTFLIEPIKIKKGQKIAQLIVSNISYPKIKLTKFLKDTERNNKGKKCIFKNNLSYW